MRPRHGEISWASTFHGALLGNLLGIVAKPTHFSQMNDGRVEDGDRYEMLWDCKFCRTPKLLGLTHRHCPVCGAPQNADGRYFPDDNEKRRVADHKYYGRDRVCEHCHTFNSRNNQHCRDCGAPLDSAKDAPVKSDAGEAKGLLDHAAQTKPRKVLETRTGSRWALWVALIVGALIVGLGVFFFWKRDTTFEVVGHEWVRTIDIERFGPVRETAWCDQLPGSARELGRHREVRSHEQVRDGETCSVRRVDQGDGTFREVKHCEPRYTSRPVYDQRCDYEVNKWAKVRSAEQKGQSLASSPEWPKVNISSCNRVGCERQGAKRERYEVRLKTAEGSMETCNLPQPRWAQTELGRSYIAQTRVLGGGVDCDSLALQ